MCLARAERVGVVLGIIVGVASTKTVPSPGDALSLLIADISHAVDDSGVLELDVMRLWQSAKPDALGTPRSVRLRLNDLRSLDDVLPQLRADLKGRLPDKELDRLIMRELPAITGLGSSFKQRPDYMTQLRDRTYGRRHVSRAESAFSPWIRSIEFRQDAVLLVDEIQVEMLATRDRAGLLDLATQMFDVVPEAVDGALIHAVREGDINLLRELAAATAQPVRPFEP